MFQISTQYEGKQYTVELHSLVLTKLNREDLYRALVRHNVPGIEKHHGRIKFSPCYHFTVSPDSAATNSRGHSVSSGGKVADLRRVTCRL